MKIDTYYDITCSKCFRSASTDWNMSMFNSKQSCKNWAKENKWKTVKDENVCFGCTTIEKIIKVLLKNKVKENYFKIEYYVEYNWFYIRTNNELIETIIAIIKEDVKELSFGSNRNFDIPTVSVGIMS